MGATLFLGFDDKPLVRLPDMKRQTTINIVVCRWFSVSLVFIPGTVRADGDPDQVPERDVRQDSIAVV